jgi:HK97 family phage prohead protease
MKRNKDANALSIKMQSPIHVERVYEQKRVSPDGQDIMVGIVEGYLATWGVDRSGDQFIKGCFDESIQKLRAKKRPLRLKRNHGELIGGFDAEKLREDDTGLYGVAEINLAGETGRYAYSLARQGVLSDFSVGVSIRLSDMRLKGDSRQILQATLWECSLVDEPMNEEAVATMVRGFTVKRSDKIDREQLYAAAATVAIEDGDEDEREKINQLYRSIKWTSPFERGVWSLKELAGLPLSLRRGIIRNERLSRDAIDAVVEALQSRAGQTERSSEDRETIEEVVRMVREKAINEDTAAEIRGLLDGKANAVQTIRALIGDDDFNEDTIAEVRGLIEGDQQRNATMLSLLGVEREGEDDEEMGNDEEEKQLDGIAAVLKGAWNE